MTVLPLLAIRTYIHRNQLRLHWRRLPLTASFFSDPSFELGDTDGCGSRAGYRAGLSVMRDAALRADIPFWNVRDLQIRISLFGQCLLTYIVHDAIL